MDNRSIDINTPHPAPKWRRDMIIFIHIIMFGLAIMLIGLITYDTLHNVAFISEPKYIYAQGWICSMFIAGVLIEILLKEQRTWRFILSRSLLIIISIPYLNIVLWLGIHPDNLWTYILQFIPMLRAAVAIAVVMGTFSSNFISSMLLFYIILLITTVYFGSLIFFVEEHFVNSHIVDFADAVWWVLDELSTVGSPVEPMTTAGQILGIMLSAEGLILFPIFTVYVTDAALRAVNHHNSRLNAA